TQDGSILRGPAALLNYDGSPPAPVKLEVLPATGDTTGTTGGYKITLPAGRNWHPVDTVIKLKRK
ncbi:MAG: hypothetical protein LBR07_07115, partial [Puniceicoccales bacterium]|nr:hypothetical protein [Puniceicoccales bacterium]